MAAEKMNSKENSKFVFGYFHSYYVQGTVSLKKADNSHGLQYPCNGTPSSQHCLSVPSPYGSTPKSVIGPDTQLICSMCWAVILYPCPKALYSNRNIKHISTLWQVLERHTTSLISFYPLYHTMSILRMRHLRLKKIKKLLMVAQLLSGEALTQCLLILLSSKSK